ncbi:MAG: hypothetical protein GY806_15450, partial [Gammaproteobacteria bacterium]|nr:hypothetical protein [Gammaproteobacteria bacterium]
TTVIDLPEAPVEQVAKALVNRAVTFGQQGNFDTEIADYTTVIDLPEAPVEQVANALVLRSVIFKDQLLIDKSVKDLISALHVNSNSPDINLTPLWNKLGNLYLDHSVHKDKALKAFLTGLKIEKNESKDYIHGNLIWCHIISGNMHSAVKQRNHIDQLPQTGIELIDAAIAIKSDNYGLSIDHLKKALDTNDPELWTSFKDDLLRLVRLMKQSGYGEKLLDWLESNSYKLKHAAFYHAVDAYISSDDLLKNINPETRKIAQPIYDWLDLDNIEISD